MSCDDAILERIGIGIITGPCITSPGACPVASSGSGGSNTSAEMARCTACVACLDIKFLKLSESALEQRLQIGKPATQKFIVEPRIGECICLRLSERILCLVWTRGSRPKQTWAKELSILRLREAAQMRREAAHMTAGYM